MKIAKIEYGTSGRKDFPFYAHLKDIKNDVTIEGEKVSVCLTKAVDMIQHPEKINIKVLRVDKAK
jgi:hypothetical protein